jgi:predicted dehydrogenase/threonine dehydrogenase-like Zn-dependent dehydrogenase
LPVRAIRNPELVHKALSHMRERGVRETLDLARGRTAPDTALGYSSAGVVLDTGGVPVFHPGQLVACGGAGSASHAEVVSVPANLVVAVPQALSAKAAAFATIGSIALQGVRRADPALGERVVVVGLGLLGLITMQILRAAGCPVLGVEPLEHRRQLASSLGVELAVAPAGAHEAVLNWTDRLGADAVLITAASPSSTIINDAVAMLRRKGRVVPIGDVGLQLDRAPLYQREADVLISTSYGPGRYDVSYEEAGIDYPFAFVRWTENRNMEEVLRLIAAGRLAVEPLVELERPVERAEEAYAAVNGPNPPLAATLTYDYEAAASRVAVGAEIVRVRPSRESPSGSGGAVRVALVGAGGFITGVHLPNIKADPDARIQVVANRSGTSAGDAARLAGGADISTDWHSVLDRDDVDLVIIGTRHDSHAEIASAALRRGKAVFVEKPLGLSREEIDEVWSAGLQNDRLAIGFNRRFSPLAEVLHADVRTPAEAPVHLIYRVSAPLATDHWLNDPAIGGGRVHGEACHMFDFANWLCGVPLRLWAAALPSAPTLRTIETLSVTISYHNGSVATIHYSGAGGASMPKERIEILSGGKSWVLDDFTTLTSYAGGGVRTQSVRRQDKGHATLIARVLSACRNEETFEPGLSAAYAAQSVALAALESVATGEAVDVLLSPVVRSE